MTAPIVTLIIVVWAIAFAIGALSLYWRAR